MNDASIHYELFVRRTPSAPWTLHAASESRPQAVQEANDLIATNQVAAARVMKEQLDAETREYKSVTILTLGAAQIEKAVRVKEEPRTPICVSPTDLYTTHARQRIARLLEGWLQRKSVTVFELLHRPDLAESLEDSGVDLQQAVQKLAIAEAGGPNGSLHDYMRSFHTLISAAIARLARDGKKGSFPSIKALGFGAVAERLAEHPDRNYLMGGAVAAYLADARTWRDKAARLADLADAAPGGGGGRALALSVLEQPLAEILGSRAGLDDLAGEQLELGQGLALLTRLAAGRQCVQLAAVDPAIKRMLPELTGPAARLAVLLEHDAFGSVRSAIARRLMAELKGQRRLRPTDGEAEIALLRALAMTLAAAAGPLLSLDDVQAAFIERSKRIVSTDFVESYLAGRDGVLAEVRALVRLAENVTGPMNKVAAARWLSSQVDALRFERAVREAKDAPSARLAALADIQRAMGRASLPQAELTKLTRRIGEAGGWVEADAKVVEHVLRAEAEPLVRLTSLIRLANGEAAPLGPASERARIELLKLVRTPQGHAALIARPDLQAKIAGLLAPPASLQPPRVA